MIAVELPSDPASNLHLSYYTIGNICIQIISKTINRLILCLSHLYPSRLRINITCGSILVYVIDP